MYIYEHIHICIYIYTYIARERDGSYLSLPNEVHSPTPAEYVRVKLVCESLHDTRPHDSSNDSPFASFRFGIPLICSHVYPSSMVHELEQPSPDTNSDTSAP